MVTDEMIAISRAAAIVMSDVPFKKRQAWARMIGDADSLADIEQPWRDKIAAQMELDRTG